MRLPIEKEVKNQMVKRKGKGGWPSMTVTHREREVTTPEVQVEDKRTELP